MSGPRDHARGRLLASKFIFQGRVNFRDSYLPTYSTFHRFCEELEAVIKTAASAASRTAAGRASSPDLVPMDLVFLEAALAADLIMTSLSIHVATAGNTFLDPAV